LLELFGTASPSFDPSIAFFVALIEARNALRLLRHVYCGRLSVRSAGKSSQTLANTHESPSRGG
jgi:hypothetical protein